MDYGLNKKGIHAKASIKTTFNQTCLWINCCGSRVTEDIVKLFKKCDISNVLDVSEGNLIYEEDKNGDEEVEESSDDFQGF